MIVINLFGGPGTGKSTLAAEIFVKLKSLNTLILDVYYQYDNINFLLNRRYPYISIGRNQTEEEAKEIDNMIMQVLIDNDINFETNYSTAD